MRIGQIQIGKDGRSLGLSNNQLKIIAMIAMTVDHAGQIIFPDEKWMRMIGRLAFPIFAYMIAEGCRYTRHRWRYLLHLAAFALGCQVVYSIITRSLYMSIFATFSLSILLIYSVDHFLNKKDILSLFALLFVSFGTILLTCVLPSLLAEYDFDLDYGLYGVMFPVVVYYLPAGVARLFGVAFMLSVKCYISGSLSLYGFFSLPLLLMYNGKRGKYKLKYLFYVFYPTHLALLYILQIFLIGS